MNKEAVFLNLPTKKKKCGSVLKKNGSHFFSKMCHSCINKILRLFLFPFVFILHHLFRLLEWRRIFLVFLSCTCANCAEIWRHLRMFLTLVSGQTEIEMLSNVKMCPGVRFHWLQLHRGVVGAKYLPTIQTTELPFFPSP